LGEPETCDDEPMFTKHSPVEHTFDDDDDTTGSAFTMMGWVKCENTGGRSWANIWALTNS